MINGTSADVCFVNRDESATRGAFKPQHLEKSLQTVHDYWLKDFPNCAMDRWVDNHYALDNNLV